MEEIYVGCVGEKATDYCISFVLVFKRITCMVFSASRECVMLNIVKWAQDYRL
jgi:hypothetical protein